LLKKEPKKASHQRFYNHQNAFAACRNKTSYAQTIVFAYGIFTVLIPKIYVTKYNPLFV